MGFSFANLVTQAMILLRVSGGTILSNHWVPIFVSLPTWPWREPVMPLIASAILARSREVFEEVRWFQKRGERG